MSAPYRVAIVHDYLNQIGGAERVVGLLHRLFPEAPIYTTILDRSRLIPELANADIRTTWMQRIPGILKHFKHFFWLYPRAVESIDLRGYDLVISSSSAYAKGISVKGDTLHVCYCHTPMRFAWDFSTYMEAFPVPPFQRKLVKWMMHPMRVWDRSTSAGVHHFIANSSIVRQRIKNYYGRESSVIYPPVNLSRFKVGCESDDYYLVVSRLVSYKRLELAVQACTRLNRKLIVIGEGPDRFRLESLAGPTVRFLGRLPDEEVVRYMQRCTAFIFPGIEDFGITPLEVNACGRPVVAFRGGGALDTIVPYVNGVFFEEQTADSLIERLLSIDNRKWDAAEIRKHAEKFSEEAFSSKLLKLIESLLKRDFPVAIQQFDAPEARLQLQAAERAIYVREDFT